MKETRIVPGAWNAALTLVGTRGTSAALTETTELTVPQPAAFTAHTRNSYVVEFTKPVTVTVVEVDTPSANVSHEAEVEILYCHT